MRRVGTGALWIVTLALLWLRPAPSAEPLRETPPAIRDQLAELPRPHDAPDRARAHYRAKRLGSSRSHSASGVVKPAATTTPSLASKASEPMGVS